MILDCDGSKAKPVYPVTGADHYSAGNRPVHGLSSNGVMPRSIESKGLLLHPCFPRPNSLASHVC